jgi:hypothetical protein
MWAAICWSGIIGFAVCFVVESLGFELNMPNANLEHAMNYALMSAVFYSLRPLGAAVQQTGRQS